MLARDTLKDHLRESELFNRRATVALAVVLAVFGALAARLVYLQVLSHEYFKTLSEQNRVRLLPEPPGRGLIYDRNGFLLADNYPAYALVVVPEQVRNMEDTLTRLGKVVALTDADLTRFRRQLRGARRFHSIPLRLRLSDEEVARFAVDRHFFPGVDIEPRLLRRYPVGELAVSVLGYVGRISEDEQEQLDETEYAGTDYVGKTGVEKYYEQALHGRAGFNRVETNAQGRFLRVLERTPPVPGKNLHLNLDVRLQAVALDALGEENGAVVALDVQNGAVLALASRPTFDPNLFTVGIDNATYQALLNSPVRPMFNRVVRGRYPPGSTIKPFLGLAGLEYRARDAQQGIYCRGAFTLPGVAHRYRDWKKEGHGSVDLRKAIVESCDVYFYDLALQLGIDRMHHFLTQFGFSQPTGIDVVGEANGLIPSTDWKRRVYRQAWYQGETLIAGIGQGYTLVTPLQLAVASAALANGGTRWVPQVLGRQEDPQTGAFEAVAPRQAGTVPKVNPENWTTVIDAMKAVVHSPSGTAHGITRGLSYEIAGKTGTAQVAGIKQGEKYNEAQTAKALRDHALFIAFAPVDRPRIAVAVLVENGGHGGSTAAPVARRVMDTYMSTLAP